MNSSAVHLNLLADRRNLIDQYKNLPNSEVLRLLDQKRSSLEIAIENVEHDFNIGTIVRNANNFNVSIVHIIGKHKYNRRGAMCTDKYLHIQYWTSAKEFIADQRSRNRELVAIENHTERVKPLHLKRFQPYTTLIFGSENSGLSTELLSQADDVREIESFGSTRSVNVGVASGIAMYEWSRQNLFS